MDIPEYICLNQVDAVCLRVSDDSRPLSGVGTRVMNTAANKQRALAVQQKRATVECHIQTHSGRCQKHEKETAQWHHVLRTVPV
jgi:hypothetical protein